MNSQTKKDKLPYLGFGIRMRGEYVDAVLRQRPDIDWFEIISENCLDKPEQELVELERIRDHYPLIMHGISLGIGSPWPLNLDYLERLRQLVHRFDPAWISDHLCWSGADDTQGNLLPLPYSPDMLEHVTQRIVRVQEFLGRQILLENVPMDESEAPPEIPEAEFLAEVAKRSDSLILLDISNLHASSINQDFDPIGYLKKLPPNRVQQIHLVGATALCSQDDSMQEQADDPVWDLYLSALKMYGPVTTTIEREDTIPPLCEMECEVRKARCAVNRALEIA